MDNGPLVKEEIVEAEELRNRYDAIRPVTAMFWLKETGEDQRYLYFVCNSFNDATLQEAYLDLLKLFAEERPEWLDPFRVKIVSPDNPFAKEVLTQLERFPGRKIRIPSFSPFAGKNVDDVYIYPAPAVAVGQ